MVIEIGATDSALEIRGDDTADKWFVVFSVVSGAGTILEAVVLANASLSRSLSSGEHVAGREMV